MTLEMYQVTNLIKTERRLRAVVSKRGQPRLGKRWLISITVMTIPLPLISHPQEAGGFRELQVFETIPLSEKH